MLPDAGTRIGILDVAGVVVDAVVDDVLVVVVIVFVVGRCRRINQI